MYCQTEGKQETVEVRNSYMNPAIDFPNLVNKNSSSVSNYQCVLFNPLSLNMVYGTRKSNAAFIKAP